jgi:hypothetical protein
MTRLAKPEKKAGKGNERRGMYANRTTKAIGCRPLNSRDTATHRKVRNAGAGTPSRGARRTYP